MKIERFEQGSTPSFLFQSAIQKYLFAVKNLKTNTVLDIACGIGYGTNIMLECLPDLQLYGCDNDLTAIEYATQNHPKKIKFSQCNAYSTRFADNFFDTVVSFETLEHLENGDLFIKEIKRILKNDGILILSTPNLSYEKRVLKKSLNPYHIKSYSYDDLKNLLCSNFKHVKIFGQRETASEIFYRFPILYKLYRIIKPLLMPFFTNESKSSKVITVKLPNPKFYPKPYWKSATYLIVLASDSVL